MKKWLLLLLLVCALPATAQEVKIKAEQIHTRERKTCYRCDYVLQDGWVTHVIQEDVEWKLKPNEALYILPFGMRPTRGVTKLYRVSPDYGKLPVEIPATTAPNE